MSKCIQKQTYTARNYKSKSLQNLLIRAGLDVIPKSIVSPIYIGLYRYQIKGAFYIATVILTLCKEFTLKLNSGRYHGLKYKKFMAWYFDFKRRDIIKMIILVYCQGTYIGETECLLECMNNT